MLLLNEQDVRRLVRGASILGTGGGGDPEYGLDLLISDLKRGRTLQLVDLEEMGSGIVVTPYFAGAPLPDERKLKDVFPLGYMMDALNSLEDKVGCVTEGVIPTEIGGGNTAIAMHIAAELRLPVGDADHVGRSAPELVHSTFHLAGIPLTPAAVATHAGDVILIEKCSSTERYEKIVRALSVMSGGIVFVVDTPVLVETALRVSIRRSISKAIDLGSAVEQALSLSEDPAEKAASFLEGKVVLRGRVGDVDLRRESGFLVGTYRVRGEGASLEIHVKNENIAAFWSYGEPAILPPDLIILMNDDGWGVVNSELKEGMEVSVVAAPAPPEWRTEAGLELMGPRHFGFDIDYVPVEALLGI